MKCIYVKIGSPLGIVTYKCYGHNFGTLFSRPKIFPECGNPVEVRE